MAALDSSGRTGVLSLTVDLATGFLFDALNGHRSLSSYLTKISASQVKVPEIVRQWEIRRWQPALFPLCNDYSIRTIIKSHQISHLVRGRLL